MTGLIWLRTGTDGSHEHINEPFGSAEFEEFFK